MSRSRFEDLEAAVEGSVSDDEFSGYSQDDSFIDDGPVPDEDSLSALLEEQAPPPGPVPAVRSAAPPAAAVGDFAQAPAAPRQGGARSRVWFFTLNKRDGEELPQPWSQLPLGASWMVFQHEREARDHYQGVVRFTSALRMSTVVTRLGSNGIHVEVCADPTTAAHYCSKPHGPGLCTCCAVACSCEHCRKASPRINGPWTLGTPPVGQGKRSDIDSMLATCKEKGYEEAVLSHPSVAIKYVSGLKEYDFIVRKKERLAAGYVKPKVYVLWGPPGVGKSRWAFGSHPGGPEAVFTKTDAKSRWWDGYSGQDRIVLDDFYGQIEYSELLILLDGHAQTRKREIKQGHTYLRNTQWVFTSNRDPRDWYSGVPDREALWNRIWHRFDGVVVHTGPGWNAEDIDANPRTPCPCAQCSADRLPRPAPVSDGFDPAQSADGHVRPSAASEFWNASASSSAAAHSVAEFGFTG